MVRGNGLRDVRLAANRRQRRNEIVRRGSQDAGWERRINMLQIRPGDHGHPGGKPGFGANSTVLDNDAGFRRSSCQMRCTQVRLGVRLAVAHVIARDGHQPHFEDPDGLQVGVNYEAVGVRDPGSPTLLSSSRRCASTTPCRNASSSARVRYARGLASRNVAISGTSGYSASSVACTASIDMPTNLRWKSAGRRTLHRSSTSRSARL